jgi:hypothetical protein
MPDTVSGDYGAVGVSASRHPLYVYVRFRG